MKITPKQQPLKQRELKRRLQNGVHLHKNVSVIKEINIQFYIFYCIYLFMHCIPTNVNIDEFNNFRLITLDSNMYLLLRVAKVYILILSGG